MKRYFALFLFFIVSQTHAAVIGGPNNYMMNGPAIDGSKIPAPQPGRAGDFIGPTGYSTTPDVRGTFRTACPFSHMNYDDVIVAPGRPGVSHLHGYAGNTAANANADISKIRSYGNSTCPGGFKNRSMYWSSMPIDTRNGAPKTPQTIEIYYKHGYNLPLGTKFAVPPVGLRMIAGSMMNNKPSSNVKFTCFPQNTSTPHIVNCPVGSRVWMTIVFPQCWDGVNLDSPDHKSHMAYPSRQACPATHPIPIPEITFNWVFDVVEKDEPLHWRLSSQMYPNKREDGSNWPAGYDAHGDWVNGWEPAVMLTWITNCLNNPKNCHNDLLGNGNRLY